MQFTFNLEEDDFRALFHSFFRQLFEGLDEALSRGRWNDHELPLIAGVRPHLAASWQEFSAAGGESIFGAVEATAAQRFVDAGLTGSQLKAKFYVLQHWSGRALGGLIGPIRRVLQIINSLLGSFKIATGVGEALQEIKELLENALDED